MSPRSAEIIWPPHHDPVITVASAVFCQIAASPSTPKTEELEESFIGKPARLLPSLALAYELAIIESNLEAGALRTAILHEVEKLAQKAVVAASEQKGKGVGR